MLKDFSGKIIDLRSDMTLTFDIESLCTHMHSVGEVWVRLSKGKKKLYGIDKDSTKFAMTLTKTLKLGSKSLHTFNPKILWVRHGSNWVKGRENTPWTSDAGWTDRRTHRYIIIGNLHSFDIINKICTPGWMNFPLCSTQNRRWKSHKWDYIFLQLWICK